MKKKVIAACSSGTFLEIYEFSLYGNFAALFSKIFFPDSLRYSLLYTLAIFSVGLVARPLGAFLFGHIGDRFGRTKALTFSILTMTIVTFCMGLMPTYENIGFLAPFLLLFGRFLQGVSSGGEYTGAGIYLIETFPSKKGLAGSIVSSSGMFGTLVSMIISSIFLTMDSSDGWRFPFIVGGILGLGSLYIRLKLSESDEYKEVIAQKKIVENPIKKILRKYRPELIKTIVVGGMNGVLTFIFVVYFTTHLNEFYGFKLSTLLAMNALAVAFFIFASLWAGMLCNRRDPRGVLKVISISISLLSIPLYYLLSSNSLSMALLSELIFALHAGAFSGACNLYMYNQFKTPVRYTGVSLGYGIGTGIFGGLAPIVSASLVEFTGNPVSPALYIIIAGLVTARICKSRSNVSTELEKKAA
ncbi:MAG: MFS transporter [Alphaproteobacteria bacterium]|nr:MFS transporter [Alphaproteobacteria bacterium]MBT5390633.1 MFS transporter [Alphaproteobacteria bacterium]